MISSVYKNQKNCTIISGCAYVLDNNETYSIVMYLEMCQRFIHKNAIKKFSL